MGYRDGLKFIYTKMDALTVLGEKTSSLLGVTELAENTLKKLGIKTIYDLATSSLFQIAQDIARLNLFLYSDGNSLGFLGTLNTAGKGVAQFRFFIYTKIYPLSKWPSLLINMIFLIKDLAIHTYVTMFLKI